MRCSTPNCPADAVTQWQQQTTPEVAAAHVEALRAQIVANNERARLAIRVEIAQLEYAAETLPDTLTAADRAVVLERIGQQIEDARQRHNTIRDNVNLDHQADVTVAVYGCDEHTPRAANSEQYDADWCTILHRADCNTTLDCGCERGDRP